MNATVTPPATAAAGPEGGPARRGRAWAYTGALLGGAVSIAANVAHSFVPPEDAAEGWAPPAGAVALSMFWPVFLFVAVEILTRIAWPSGARWTALRFAGLLPVALVAALVSYRHLAGLLTAYGEDPLTTALGPLAVDGLMVMATGALLATAPTTTAATVVAEVAEGTTAPAAIKAAPAPAAVVELAPATDTVTNAGRVQVVPARSSAARSSSGRSTVRSSTARPSGPVGSRAVNGTAARVARLRRENPSWTTGQVAAAAGVTPRTVRRHLNGTPTTPRMSSVPTTPDGAADVPAAGPVEAVSGVAA